MSNVLPAISNAIWDVVSEAEGFSAEGSLERDLDARELADFEVAAAEMPPVVRDFGQIRIRGMATVDDETLWVYVHAVGPGRFDDQATRAASIVLTDLWQAIHEAATRV